MKDGALEGVIIIFAGFFFVGVMFTIYKILSWFDERRK